MQRRGRQQLWERFPNRARKTRRKVNPTGSKGAPRQGGERQIHHGNRSRCFTVAVGRRELADADWPFRGPERVLAAFPSETELHAPDAPHGWRKEGPKTGKLSSRLNSLAWQSEGWRVTLRVTPPLFVMVCFGRKTLSVRSRTHTNVPACVIRILLVKKGAGEKAQKQPDAHC